MSDKIDDTLSGITPTSEIVRMGRPDIEDRPGEALVEAVTDYRAAGGFRREGQTEELERRDDTPLPAVKGLVSRYTTDPEEPEHDLKD